MAKQGKELPARRQREREEPSVLLKSAESLGRVIGLLQRQLDDAAARVGRKGRTDTARMNGDGNSAPARVSRSGRASANGSRTVTRTKSAPPAKKASKRAATTASASKTTKTERTKRKTTAARKRRSG
jgi:hypothetical protein